MRVGTSVALHERAGQVISLKSGLLQHAESQLGQQIFNNGGTI